MTVAAQPTGLAPAADAGGLRVRRRRTATIAVLAVALLFGLTYVYAWTQANALSSRYLAEADRSYDQGKYLDALVGYQDFDQRTNAYVSHGGYLPVERIWANRYAWPVPAGVQRARARINEIIYQKLTVAQAEQFVQEHMGQRNPYFGVIYLRLGELYQQAGQTNDARDVYETVVQSFPERPDLVQQAEDHLARLPK